MSSLPNAKTAAKRAPRKGGRPKGSGNAMATERVPITLPIDVAAHYAGIARDLGLPASSYALRSLAMAGRNIPPDKWHTALASLENFALKYH